MKFGTIIVYGDRYEFKDVAPTVGGLLLLDDAMMMYHAMDFAKQVHVLQTYGSCLVMVELASLVVSRGGHRPPTNATNRCFDWKATRATRFVYSCPRYLCPRYQEPTGLYEKSTRWESKLTTWTHHASSWYAVIT